jgi:hypothetical protein
MGYYGSYWPEQMEEDLFTTGHDPFIHSLDIIFE